MYGPLDILSIETWILLITAILAARYYINQKYQVLKKLNIPHAPPSIFRLGNIDEMMSDLVSFFKKDLVRKKKYGKIYGTYVGVNPRITIADPEILKQIQLKEAGIFRDRQRSFSKVNGKEMNQALTSAEGDHWKRIRSTISPVFSTSKLKDMIGIMDRCTDKMVKNLHKISKDEDGKFMPTDVLSKLSLDVICSTSFNVDMHTQDDGEEPTLIKMGRKLFDIQLSKSFAFFTFFVFPSTEWIGELINYSIFPSEAVKYFAGLVDALIKNKDHDKTRVDMMTQMLNEKISEEEAKTAHKGLTRNEIVGNSIVMIMGGYETTANTMMFVIYNLASHKHEQDKCREEIKKAVEKHGGLTYEAIGTLTYLTQCINETLRVYPAVIRNSRYCEKEITIQGVTIPAGIHVDIPTYGMSRDEEYWDEPTKFKPERMEDMSKIDPIIFQPFGAGPRNCIGMRFALIEMKMAISKILLNFEVDMCPDTPEPPLEIIFKASVRPKEDFSLKVTPLNSE
uniref:Cytochrome P450 CYP3-like member 3 n=1 Tax=Phallusia mammillata TaxID=59560 RepID=A0A6F9DB03_9ASCI|nr:cytochrome P450 CYP3-like member 3 [Phallusia mammillata]